MSEYLERILNLKRLRIEAAKEAVPPEQIVEQAENAPAPRDFKAALLSDGLSIIAEIKRASPSKGVLVETLDVEQLARRYEQGGASAISVLTEEDFFAGSLNDLRRVKQVTDRPILRKDFIVDPYQVWESRAAGADAILLIASALDLKPLRQLLLLARDLNLTALVEVHGVAELGKAMDAGADVVGVNSRNLKDFGLDLQIPLSLAEVIPPGIVKVAESGVSTRDEVVLIKKAGYDAVLIGQALVQAKDPVEKLKELTMDDGRQTTNGGPSSVI
jgi:indole-3-glycerol phosphate synthase